MKWLLAMLSKGRDVSEFFADVVKNVAVKSIEVKKMIYNYLVHYADYDDSCREIALLSINSFQKDMSGSNQLIRGLALRVLTSIRVSDIIQIQLLAVRKCATDSSPYVRKCAATACCKIFILDPEQLPQLQQILEKLLKDNSTMVLGSAIAAFNEICPTNYSLIHRSYRKICHLLADMDEWSQISCLEVLTRYVRNQFTDPAPGATAAARLQSKQRSASALKGKLDTTVKRRIVRKAFYSDEEDEEDEEEVEVEQVNLPERGSIFSALNDIEGDLDPDHRLVLRSAFPLLKSRNSGVVLGVCALHYYCSAQGDRNNQQVGKALVRILRNHREIQYVVLTSIHTMARDRPVIFRPFLSEFFVKSSDPIFNRLLKLDILTSICFKENVIPILKELQVYIKDSNQSLANATIHAIGRVVDCDPEVAGVCMDGLMHLLLCSKQSDIVVGETVTVLRQLIQQNTSCDRTSKTLFQLARLLVDRDHPMFILTPIARSSIVWLVGEYHEAIGKVSPDILRVLCQGFVEEDTETKIQILNYAMKLAIRYAEDEAIQNLMTYVLEMARYDMDIDLRDRSRFMTALMGLAPSGDNIDHVVDEAAVEELASHSKEILLAPKLPPVTLLGCVDVEGLLNFTVGSLSSLVGHHVTGYEAIAPWPTVQPDPNVRDALRLGSINEGESNGASGDKVFRHSHGGGKSDLKDFYRDAERDNASDASEDSDSDSGEESSSSSDDDASSDDNSSSDDDSDQDDDDSSEDSSSSDDESESEAASESSSEDELITRIPINAQSKASSVIRQGVGMRKITAATSNPKSKRDIENNDSSTSMDLLAADFGSTSLLQPSNTFSATTNIPLSSATTSTFDSLESFIGSAGKATADPYALDGFGSSSANTMIATQRPVTSAKVDDVFSNDFLGLTPLSSVKSVNPTAVASMSSAVTLTDPKPILRPEMGGGLSVSIVYQYGTIGTAFQGATTAMLLLRNQREHPLR
jgi:AP-3 complex subunit beta